MTEWRFLLDANICVYLLGGSAPLLRRRIEDSYMGSIATSAVAFGEVMIGAARRDAAEKAIEFFKTVPVLPFDERAGAAYASLPFRHGRVDRLIAAHALSLDLTLVTNNERDFADVPGLTVENWTR